MLSYNIEKKFDKILERIKYKLDTKGLSKFEIYQKQRRKDCEEVTPDEFIEAYEKTKSRIPHLQNLKNKIPIYNMASSLHAGRFARGSQSHEVGILSQLFDVANQPGMTDEKALWDNPEAKKVSSFIRNLSSQLSEKMGIDENIAIGIVGVSLKASLNPEADTSNDFLKDSNDVEFNAVTSTITSTLMNGAKQYLPDIAHSIQNYSKRLRGAVKKEDWVGGVVGGQLLPADHPKYANDPIAKRNQQMAIAWKGTNRDGYSEPREQEWEVFLQKQSKGEIQLYDSYIDGVIDKQVPKNIIEAIHTLDTPSIINAIKLIKSMKEEGNNFGALWSNKKDRKEFLKQIREHPSIQGRIEIEKIENEDGTIGYKKIDDPKLAVFLHALENGEYNRAFNNQTQVEVNGRGKIYQHVRNIYDGVLQNILTLEHHGGETVLHDGQKVSSRGLIGEVAKFNVSKQLAIDWMKQNPDDPLSQGENPSMRLILIARYQGLKITENGKSSLVKISAELPTAIDGVDTFFTNSIIKNFSEADPLWQKEGRNYVTLKNKIIEEFGLKDMLRVYKDGKSVGDVINSEEFMQSPQVRQKVVEKIKNSLSDQELKQIGGEEALFEGGEYIHQVDSFMSHLNRIRKDQDTLNRYRSQDKDTAEITNKLKKLTLTLVDPKDEDNISNKYFSQIKSEKNKLRRGLNSDKSWSSTELPEENDQISADKGYLNKSLDEYTMSQVTALENGRPSLKYRDGYQGASLWGFEDHHIYGKGDNQANTHFALVFRPFHQNGLHLANFMIEGFATAKEHISLLHEYVLEYEKNSGLILDPENRLDQKQIDLIKELHNDDNKLRALYRVNKKGEFRLKEGSTIPTITSVPIKIGDNIEAIKNREKLNLTNVKSMYFYPPITEKVTGSAEDGTPSGYYKDVIQTRGGEYLANWGNGTILDTPKAFELDWIGEDGV